MYNVVPLFKTHYSLGRSILTCDKDDRKPDYPVSIFSIAKDNNLKEIYLLEDNFSSFMEAQQVGKAKGVKVNYGIKFTIIPSLLMLEKEPKEWAFQKSKVNIFIRNQQGYKDLIKIWSFAATKGSRNGVPHLDYDTLRSMWSDKNLTLSIPFYDSFLYQNNFYMGNIVPQLDFTDYSMFIEDNNLIHDDPLQKIVKDFAGKNNKELVPAQTICYETRKDFLAYLTFRCINNRSTLEKPELDHLSSDTFSFEHWIELNKNFNANI